MTNTRQLFELLQQYIEGELGNLARAAFYAVETDNSQKYDGSVVTEVDTAIERNLKQWIKNYFPSDAMYGEEEGFVSGTSEYVWVIDPIDGTDNFVRKIPFFAITVARLGNQTEGTFSIIYNPVSRQLFSSFEQGAVCENGVVCKPLTDTVGGHNFITVTGANSSAVWIKEARQNIQKGLYLEFGKSGHYHSSLLEHAYVAAGRLDGLLQIEMNAWDSAAGVYLVIAGGGVISVLHEGTWIPHSRPITELYGADFSHKPTIFVSRPHVHERALSFIGQPDRWQS